MRNLRLILSLVLTTTLLITMSGCGTNVATANNRSRGLVEEEIIYSDDVQNELLTQLEKKKNSRNYTFRNPLYLINPFKTNTTSLYLYFKTEQPSMVEYTVHVNDKNIKDFTRTLYNVGENNLTTEHEYSLIGLVGGKRNRVTLKLYDENHKLIGVNVITVRMPKLAESADEALIKENGDSTEELSDGLFVTLGHINSGDNTSYLYDNDGIARGELNLDSYRIDKLLFKDDLMYISTGINKISAMTRFGYAERTYDLGKYELHHDYVFGKDNSLILLASNPESGSIEDLIIKLDLDTGIVTELLDLADCFGELKDKAIISTTDNKTSLDWIHVNSISFVNDTDVILSARETSTIIKINNIYSNPTIGYMIGPDIAWKNTPYSKYFLKQNGDFTLNGGQHSVEVIHDNSLKEGQYYLDLYNNNLGYSGSYPELDWNQIDGINSDESMYYRYLVDENNKTFTLIDELTVAKSKYISNIQHYDDHLIIDSGNAFSFAEYDSNKNLIANFKIEQGIWGLYRCYKENFNNFYFYEN